MQPETLVYLALVMVSISFSISFYRVFFGPSLPDRVVAVDLIGVTAVALAALGATISREPAFLDAAVVIALLGFLGTIAYARYVERRRHE